MRKRFWLLILMVLFFTPLVFAGGHGGTAPSGGCGGGGGEEQWELIRAIHELSDPDQYVRRNAARKIKRLAHVKGIKRAVSPLMAAISKHPLHEGSFNRSTFLGALGAVIREMKSGHNITNMAIDFIAEVLATDDSDLVRCGAANGLGSSSKERAIEPLEIAAVEDPSPLVRAVAAEMLRLLKKELGIEDAQTTNKPTMVLSATGNEGSEGDELEEYVRTHFIFFGKDF